MIGLYLLCIVGGLALLAYLTSRYREYVDPADNPKYSAVTLPHQYSISGRVLDSGGTPVTGALVRATGPLVAAVATTRQSAPPVRIFGSISP